MIDCDVKDAINISKGHVSKVACCQKQTCLPKYQSHPLHIQILNFNYILYSTICHVHLIV